MSVVEEINQLVSGLPAEKGEIVLQFARFLSEQAGDQAWDRSLAAAATLPKFRQELADVDREIAEGKATPLDLGDL
jgi:hypothetical protein